MVIVAMKLKDAYSLEEKLWPHESQHARPPCPSPTPGHLDSIFKNRDIILPTKVRLVKAMVFPVVMHGCELDYEKSWAPKNWCFWTVVGRRLLRVPWTARRSNQSILKEISPGCSLQGMLLKLKLQYFGHLMRRVDSLEKTDAGRDWGQEEKGTTEDEMVRWHHRLNGHGFGWTLGVGDGQGGLACCGSWGHRESDTTEQLNWTELKTYRRRVSNNLIKVTYGQHKFV